MMANCPKCYEVNKNGPKSRTAGEGLTLHRVSWEAFSEEMIFKLIPKKGELASHVKGGSRAF